MAPTTEDKGLSDSIKKLALAEESEVDEEFIEDPNERIHPAAASVVPELFKAWPPVVDALETHTSRVQRQTVETILPYLGGVDETLDHNDYGVPGIDRTRHANFLRRLLLSRLPGGYILADASRPWFLYWCLNGLALLGEDVTEFRPALVDTAHSMQNASGGFGGGYGQTSHLATTYAVVLALTTLGGEDAYRVVDRKAMWRWLCSLKQPDGGFQMAYGGEEDVRGAYCAAVIISLLNLPLDLSPDSPAWTPEMTNLFTGLADYVRLCQTFEGGISGQPNAEAHGAYAFCALGCLSILDAPHRIIPQYLDVPRLIAWLSSRQYAPEGGMAGRTNKLVDGCYSHWVGGCWPLIEACLNGVDDGSEEGQAATSTVATGSPLPAAKQSLFSREGLIRYILCCCQDETKRGGLRDKPGMSSDAYHSCYVLLGLSSCQYQWTLVMDKQDEAATAASFGGAPAKWVVTPHLDSEQIFDEADRLCPTHPVYVVPRERVDEIQEYFFRKEGF